MVSEADVRRAARELERRAQKAEEQLATNTYGLRKLTEILKAKGILEPVDIKVIYRL
jgi:hypothetical protein